MFVFQLEEIKATRGERVEDGTVAADKSLAEILAENKAKKEEEFQEVWKSMKVVSPHKPSCAPPHT